MDTGVGEVAAFVSAGTAVVGLSDAVDVAHAWTDFYRTEYPRLARTLFAYTGNPEVASELAQDAMARAWSNWGRVGRLENPGAWTCRVALNLANSAWRRLAHARRFALHATPVEEAAQSDIELGLAVRQAVALLPRRQRTAIALRYFADLSVHEVARIMRCRPGTVTAMTAQAMERLRACAALTDEEGRHEQ